MINVLYYCFSAGVTLCGERDDCQLHQAENPQALGDCRYIQCDLFTELWISVQASQSNDSRARVWSLESLHWLRFCYSSHCRGQSELAVCLLQNRRIRYEGLNCFYKWESQFKHRGKGLSRKKIMKTWKIFVKFSVSVLAPSAVQNLNVVEISPRTVNVSWSPPLYPNGIVRSYHITYTAEDETVRRPFSDD